MNAFRRDIALWIVAALLFWAGLVAFFELVHLPPGPKGVLSAAMGAAASFVFMYAWRRIRRSGATIPPERRDRTLLALGVGGVVFEMGCVGVFLYLRVWGGVVFAVLMGVPAAAMVVRYWRRLRT